MLLIFTVIKDKLDRKFGCFELFGFDFLLDDNLNPYLIEINTNPALYTDTQVQKDLLPKLVDDIVKMSLAVHSYGKVEGAEEVRKLLESGMAENQIRYDIIHSEVM
jgi:predicted ATP-grasp superfamily ATP-dependent carboligase